MKTNELSQEEMKQTNGGLTIRQLPETGETGAMPDMDPTPPVAEKAPVGGMLPNWDQPQNSGDVSPM